MVTPLICRRCGGTTEAQPLVENAASSLTAAAPCRCSRWRATHYYDGPCTPVVRWATGAYEETCLLEAIQMAKDLVRRKATAEATVWRSEDGALLFTARRPA